MALYTSLDPAPEAPQEEPEILPFIDWSQDQGVTDTQTDTVADYADYVRKSYLTAGQYNRGVEQEIRTGVNQIMSHFELEGPRQRSHDFESNYKLLLDTTKSNDEIFDSLSHFDAARQIVKNDGLIEAGSQDDKFTDKYESLHSQVQGLTRDDALIARAKRRKMSSGQVKFVEVMEKDSETGEDRLRIEVGNAPEEGDLQKHILQAIEEGTLSPENAHMAQALVQRHPETGQPAYKFTQKAEVSQAVNGLFNGDDADLADRYSEITLENLAEHFANLDQGKPSNFDIDTLALGLSLDLEKSKTTADGMTYDPEQIKTALESLGSHQAMARGKYTFYDNEDDLGLNIRTMKDGTVFAHPSLLVNERLYNQAVDQRRDTLSPLQIRQLEHMREQNLIGQFDNYNELLMRSPETASKWARYRNNRMAVGDSNADILSDFLSEEDNFSEAKTRLNGVGASVVDGVGELFAFIPAMAGNEGAQKYLADNAQQRADRRELARAFGEEFGIGQDILEAVAPMVVDLTATALLVPVTAGGSVAGFVAKQGGRLTAKGAAQAIVSKSLMQTATDTAQSRAAKATAAGLIKDSVDPADAVKLIEGYNNIVKNSSKALGPIFLTSANRSGASTYGSVYNTLRQDERVSAEDRHQAALGAGLTAAALTGAITTAFSSFGRGGVEDLVAAGATKAQIKATLQAIAKTDDLSDGVFKDLVKKRLKQTLAEFGLKGEIKKGYVPAAVKAAVDEAQEEGLDSFVNTIVEEAWTGEDPMPLAERLKQAAHGAIVGGILGGGMTTTMDSSRKMIYGNDVLAGQAMLSAENEFITNVQKDMKKAGSPLTAEFVGTILRAGGRQKLKVGDLDVDRSFVVDLMENRLTEEQEAELKTQREAVEDALDKNTDPQTVRRVIMGLDAEQVADQDLEDAKADFADEVRKVEAQAQAARTIREITEEDDLIHQTAADMINEALALTEQTEADREAFLDKKIKEQRAKVESRWASRRADLGAYPEAQAERIPENTHPIPGTDPLDDIDLLPSMGPLRNVILEVWREEDAKKTAIKAGKMLKKDPAGGPLTLRTHAELAEEVQRRYRIAVPKDSPEDQRRVYDFRRYSQAIEDGRLVIGKGISGSRDYDLSHQAAIQVTDSQRVAQRLAKATGRSPEQVRMINYVMQTSRPSLVQDRSFYEVAASEISVADVAAGMVYADTKTELPKGWETKAREIEKNQTRQAEQLTEIHPDDPLTVKGGKVPTDGRRIVLSGGKETNVRVTNPKRGQWDIYVGDNLFSDGFSTKKEVTESLGTNSPELVKAGAAILDKVDVAPSPAELIELTNAALGVQTPAAEGVVRGDPPPKEVKAEPNKETPVAEELPQAGEPEPEPEAPKGKRFRVGSQTIISEIPLSGFEVVVSDKAKKFTPLKLGSGLPAANSIPEELHKVYRIGKGKNEKLVYYRPVLEQRRGDYHLEFTASAISAAYANKTGEEAIQAAKDGYASSVSGILSQIAKAPEAEDITSLDLQRLRLIAEGFTKEVPKEGASEARKTHDTVTLVLDAVEEAPDVPAEAEAEAEVEVEPEDALSEEATKAIEQKAKDAIVEDLAPETPQKNQEHLPVNLEPGDEIELRQKVLNENGELEEMSVATGIFLNSEPGGRTYYLSLSLQYRTAPADATPVPAKAGALLVARQEGARKTMAQKQAEFNLKVARNERAARRREIRQEAKRAADLEAMVDPDGFFTSKVMEGDIADLMKASEATVKIGRENFGVPLLEIWVTRPESLKEFRDELQEQHNQLVLDEREFFRNAEEEKAKQARAKADLVASVITKANIPLEKYNKVAGDALPLSVSPDTAKLYHLDPAIFPVTKEGIRQFAAAEKLVRLGYPVGLRNGRNYGYPMGTREKTTHVKAAIAAAIKERYPTVNFTDRPGYDTIAGGAPVRVFGDKEIAPVFDNDPKHVELQLAHYPSVKIDEKMFKRSDLNPSIKTRRIDGELYATDVLAPDPLTGRSRYVSTVTRKGDVTLKPVELNFEHTDNLTRFNTLISTENASKMPIGKGMTGSTVEEHLNAVEVLYSDYAMASQEATRASKGEAKKEEEARMAVETPLTHLLFPSRGRPLTTFGGGPIHLDNAAQTFTVYATNEVMLTFLTGRLHAKRGDKGGMVVPDGAKGKYRIKKGQRKRAVNTVLKSLRSGGSSDAEIRQVLSEAYGISLGNKYAGDRSVDQIVEAFIEKKLLTREPHQIDTHYKSAKRAADNIKRQLEVRGVHTVTDFTQSMDAMLESQLAQQQDTLAEEAAFDESRIAETSENPDLEVVGGDVVEAWETRDNQIHRTLATLDPDMFDNPEVNREIRDLSEQFYEAVIDGIDRSDILHDSLVDLYVAGPRGGEVPTDFSPNDMAADELLSDIMRYLNSRSNAEENGDIEAQEFYHSLTEEHAHVPGAKFLKAYLGLFTDLGIKEGQADESTIFGEALVNHLRDNHGLQLTQMQARAYLHKLGDNARKALLEITTASEQKLRTANASNTKEGQDLGLLDSSGAMTKDAKAAVNALHKIARSNRYPVTLRTAAQALADNAALHQNVDLQIYSKDRDSSIAGVFSHYQSGLPYVHLNLNGHNGDGLASALVHEYMHASLSNAVNADPESLSPAQQVAIQKLKDSYEGAKKLAGDTEHPRLSYGLSSLDEYVAHLMTSSEFQNELRNLRKEGEPEGWLQRTIRAIQEFFGFAPAESASAKEQADYDALIDLSYATNGNPESGSLQSMFSQAALATMDDVDQALRWNKMMQDQRKQLLGDRIIDEKDALEDIGEADPNALPLNSVTKFSELSSPKKRMLHEQLTDLVRRQGHIPQDVTVVMSEEQDQAAWVDPVSGFLNVNPTIMDATLKDMPRGDGRRAILFKAVQEELAHISSLRSISEPEMRAYEDSLSDEDVQQTEAEYRGGSIVDPESTDPGQWQAHKRQMAEERLRSFSQRAMYGSTTEEDAAFLRTNPNAMQATVYYLRQRRQRLLFNLTKGGMTDNEAKLVGNINNELRRMKANYKPTQPYAGLSGVDDLERSAAQFARQMGIRVSGEDIADDLPGLFDENYERVPTIPEDSDDKVLALQVIEGTQEGGVESPKQEGEESEETPSVELRPWVMSREQAAENDAIRLAAQLNKGDVVGGQSPRPDPRYLFTSLSQNVPTKKKYDGEETYDAFFNTLKMPLMEVGAYAAPSKYLSKLVKGEFDPRVRRIMDFKRRFERSSREIIERYKADMDRKIEALDDKSGINELIAKASGYLEGTVTEDTWDKIQEDKAKAVEAARNIPEADIEEYAKTLMKSNPDLSERKAKGQAASELRNNRMAAAEAAADQRYSEMMQATRKIAIASRNKAANELRRRSPELYASVENLRRLTDKFSKSAGELLGGEGHVDIRAVFDNNLGVYITRAYRFFDDAGYRDQVRGFDDKGNPVKRSKEVAETLAIADKFFETEGRRHFKELFFTMNKGATDGAAEAYADQQMANKVAGTSQTYGELARIEYMAKFSGRARSQAVVTAPELVEVIDSNLRRRKDVPEELRNLLGEYGAEQGADLLLRSFAAATGVYASHKMLDNLKTQAALDSDADPDNTWLVAPDKVVEHFGSENAARAAGFEQVQVAAGNNSPYNPLKGYWAPSVMVQAIEHAATPEAINQNVAAARHAVDIVSKRFAQATGLSMAIKTLGSIGHFMRNISSQPFMAIAQGRPNIIPRMSKDLLHESRELLPYQMQKMLGASDAIVEEKRLEYINMGILKNEVRAGTLRDLLKGETTVDELQDGLLHAMKEHKGKFEVAHDKFASWIAQVEATTEAYYKIALYEDTVATLTKAKEEGTGKIRGVPIKDMNKQDIKREAAEQVLQVTPSYDKTMPWVTETTKSGIGLMIAPFLRWKSEMVRTPIGTIQLAMDEINSGNAVLKRRGLQRMTGLMAVSAMSTILPVAASQILGGIGDDEDEALRASMPEYLRNHSFFYFMKDGKLRSIDLTYVNPFSQIGDPFVRSWAEMMKGDWVGAGIKLFEVGLADVYLDDQILMSAVLSAKGNRDATTGQPIWTPGVDGPGEAVLKALTYVADEAFKPRILDDAIQVFNNYSGDYQLMEDHPMQPFLNGVMPFRTHTVDTEQQLRRYLYDQQQKYNTISTGKYRLATAKPMSDRDIADNYQEEVEDKIRLNKDIYNKIVGFEGLGMTKSQIYSAMKQLRYGDQRSMLLFNGLMVKPQASPKFISTLRSKGEFGIARSQEYLRVESKQPAMMRLED